jgi:hypothetical protein
MQGLDFLAQEFYDPATAKPRTIAELREQARRGDEQAQKDWQTYLAMEELAEASEARRRQYSVVEDRRNNSEYFRSLGEATDNTEAILMRAAHKPGRGEVLVGGGRGFVHAEYQADTNTWVLRDFLPGKALEFVRQHFDADAPDMRTWVSKQRKAGRELESGVVTDKTRLRAAMTTRLENALNVARQWAIADHIERVEEGGFVTDKGEAVRTGEIRQMDAGDLLHNMIGDTAFEALDRWLAKHPRPPGPSRERSVWEREFEAVLTTGPNSLRAVGNRRIAQGLDPLTGRRMVRDPNTGEWSMERPAKPDGGPGYTLGLGLGGFDWSRAKNAFDWRRDMTGMARAAYNAADQFVRKAAALPQAAYGLVHGMTADMTSAAFSTFITQPIQRLSRAMYSMATSGGHKDAADTLMGWSPEADHIATQHNRHLARVDRLASEHNRIVGELRRKFTRDQLLDLVRAEHEGKRPPALKEYNDLMAQYAQEAQDLGLAGKNFNARLDRRYVRMGRWKWTDPQRLRQARIDAQKTVARLAEELAAFQKIQAESSARVTDAMAERMATKQRDLVNAQAQMRQLARQIRRSERRFLPQAGIRETHNHPMELVDARKIREWEDSSRRREVDDWDALVKKGLDTDKPELLLLDGLQHASQAIEVARWMKEIANDPRMSRDLRDAPKGWEVLSKAEVGSNFAFSQLAGKAVSPWLYHFIKLSEGPNGIAEKVMHYFQGAAKMAVTMASPANWTLQTLANPLMVAVKSGTSVFRAYPAYVKALADLLLRPSTRAQFQAERWLDVATDFDREIMAELRRRNPNANADSIMRTVQDMLHDFGQGQWRGGMRGAAQALNLSSVKALGLVSRVYRTLDAAARVANYRLLRDQGRTHQEAALEVNRGWDLMHQNKYGDFLRKGVFTLPGKKGRKIPLPFLANSFASVPMTFIRNFAQVAGKTPLMLMEMAVMVGMWNSVVQSYTGQTDDEVDRMTGAMHNQSNSLTHWIRRKTTPLLPSGRQGLDFWGYHPIGAALDAIPGADSGFWGASEFIASGGERGGAFEGTNAYGQNLLEELQSSALGGKHIVLKPHAEFFFDRDDQGRPVRYRYEAPGLLGRTGWARMAVENGQASLAGAMALSSLAGMSAQTATEVGAVASALTQVVQDFQTSDIGARPGFVAITPGEDIFEVRPRSWEDVAMRRFGIKVRNPDAFRRTFERVAARRGIERGPRGNFLVDRDVPAGPLRIELMTLASRANKLRSARSGLFLWGLARHYQLTRNPHVLAEIERRWPSAEARMRAARALVTLDMSRESGETLQLLAEFGLPFRDAGVPRQSPSDVRELLNEN